jgi:hypothetical protein
MRIVDKKCPNCNIIVNDLIAEETDLCSCGFTLERIFGFRKLKEFKPGLYDHFEHDPIYIETREQYREECDKRGLVCTDGAMGLDSVLSPRRHHYEFKKADKSFKTTPEEAALKACETLGIE